MLRRNIVLFQAIGPIHTKPKNPFETLELPRHATKKEVKVSYRNLAKKFHPDGPEGDSKRMEELNRAYHLLIKEGGYEKMAAPAPGTGGIKSTATGSSTGKAGFDDFVDLDPETRRVVPDGGGFAYKRRGTDDWVRTEEPITNSSTPRYATYGTQPEEMETISQQVRAMETERRQRMDEFEGNNPWIVRKFGRSDWVPWHGVWVVAFGLLAWATVAYCMLKGHIKWRSTNAQRIGYHLELRRRRELPEEIYPYYHDEMHMAATIAAAALLAAAQKKELSDPEVAVIDPLAANLQHKYHWMEFMYR